MGILIINLFFIYAIILKVHACEFSCDSEFLISGSTDTVAKIWSVESGEVIRTLKYHR